MSHKSNVPNSPQKGEGSKSHLHHSKSHTKSEVAGGGSHHSKSGLHHSKSSDHHSSKSGVHHSSKSGVQHSSKSGVQHSSKSGVHHKSTDGPSLNRALSKSKSGEGAGLKRSGSQRSGKKENTSPLAAHHSKSHSGSKSSLGHGKSHHSKSQVKSSIFSAAGAGKSQSYKSSLGPMHINNFGKLHELQKSVVKSRIEVGPAEKAAAAGGKSGHEKSGVGSSKSPRSRERVDPRTMKRNDNKPVEASAAHTSAKKGRNEEEEEESYLIKQPGSSGAYFDMALLPVKVYTVDVRYEFQTSVMSNIGGTPYDPLKFLKPPSDLNQRKNFLFRHIDPEKVIDFMYHHMKVYYDLEADPDPYSGKRQNMDNCLWDNLAFIIPMLCRDVIDTMDKEPMIISIDVDPDVIIFGDIHGNFNDIHHIYKHYISNPEYKETKFLFLGDYVDRGPKPVEVLCFLFALRLSNPKRFFILRGNHEVLKINRKYGFQHMCCHLFLDTYVAKPTLAELNYKSFNRAFCYLPCAAVIKGSAASSGSSSGSGSSSKSGTESSKSGTGSKSGTDSKSGSGSKSGSSESKSGSKSGSGSSSGSSSHWSNVDGGGGGVKRIFCCHGGVPSYRKEEKSKSKSKSGTEVGGSKSKAEPVEGATIWTVEALNAAVKKPASLEPSRHGPPGEYAFNEILWNDPIPKGMRNTAQHPYKYYINRKRGGHCCFFSESGLRAFLEANGLSLVVRGHQYRHSMATGYHYDFEGHLLTVFSSSNYCGTEENATGYVHVKGPDCHVTPHTLRTVAQAEPYRQFNILKIVVDEHTHAVTDVAF